MDRRALLLVLSPLLCLMVEGRSWRNDFPKGSDYGDRGIVFKTDYASWWHNNDQNLEKGEHGRHSYEPGNKQLRNWDPDRVWFPDFDDSHFTTRHVYPHRYQNLTEEYNDAYLVNINNNNSITVFIKHTGIKIAPPSTEQTPVFPIDINECISQCPTTSEYNPVCGTNRVTYSNLGRLECARICGVDVRVFRKLPCSLVSQDKTTVTESTTEAIKNIDAEQRQCIQTCPTTPEYNPICGTNNVTYQNIGRLECAKFCGVVVEVKRLSPCPTPVNIGTASNQDLFNSDQVQWTTSTTSSTFKPSTESPDKPKVTISQEILNEIFNIPTANSEEFDIDIRQKE